MSKASIEMGGILVGYEKFSGQKISVDRIFQNQNPNYYLHPTDHANYTPPTNPCAQKKKTYRAD